MVFAAWALGWESLVPFNAALSVWVLLLAPLLAGLLQQGQPRLTLAVAGGVTAAVMLGDSEASKLALILGAGGAGLAWALARPALVLRAVLWGFVPVVVAMPWAIQAVLSDATFRALAPMMGFSLQHRMVIWQFVAARIAEHPVFGWGLGAARAFRGAKETVAVVLPGVGWQEVTLERLPIHPHNMPLQLWLETGGVGVALVCAGLLVLGARAKTGSRERSWSTAVRVGGVVAGLSLTLASYEAWQAWILLSAALAVGVDRRGFGWRG
ncbi:O-antigen ligase family protein [Pararhodospirillum photometricum]|uniref:O-antigen polymerase n=1 Tax=Pararhodospirillum photometricum DSM 122 TaxID=1150469 RepID=H6SJK1_PARPM|nr:O-antigen ligase family protein [Pararhodospirillum photometricum]CCG08166.1 O-antigen polymerase [Pararhodospirillum photometricum DSM 122]